LAGRAADQVPTYAYEFADRTTPSAIPSPYMEPGVQHGADLLYWFQTPLDGLALSLNPAQTRLSDQMIGYWKSFAESGQVNWPRYSKTTTPVMSLVPDASKVMDKGAFQRQHQCSGWSILYSLRASGAV
jgi:para-nitrobenzyl esterase